MKLKHMKSYLILFTLIVGTGMMFVPQQAQAQATEVNIGLLTPLTGGLGPLGPTFQNAATMAVNELNAMQSDLTFKLTVQDTETDSTATSAAVSSLVSAGVSGFIGAASSGNTLVAIEAAKSNKIPLISYASTSPAITTVDDNDFAFRVVLSDAFQGVALANLMKDDGITTVSIIGLSNAYGQGLISNFQSNFDGTVQTTQSYPEDQSDFSSLVTAALADSPDAVLMVSYNTDGAAILDELASNSYSGAIYGTDGTQSSAVFDDTSDPLNFNGTRGTGFLVDPAATFATQYEGNYTEAPGIFVADAYDATMIMGKAAIAAGSAKGCEIANNLRDVGTNYAGASKTITFDSNGDVNKGTYTYWQAHWNGSAGTFLDEGTYDVNGTPATGDVPADHCASDQGGFLPFDALSFFLGFTALATIVITLRKKQLV